MYENLKGRWAGVTLPAKSIFLGLLCGLVTWTFLDLAETRQLNELLVDDATEELRQEAASNRMIFHRYLKQHVQLTELIASYQPLIRWLDAQQQAARPPQLHRYKKERPDWFPPTKSWRGIIDPDHFLLHDTDGRLRAIYGLAEEEPPLGSELNDILSTGRSKGQIHLVDLADHPHLVASADIIDTGGRKLGSLALLSRFDDEFIGTLGYATDAPKVIMALFEGTEKRLLASNQPQLLTPGVRLDDLQQDFLATGKPFFDYGSSQLRLQLATLMSRDRLARLNASILGPAQNQHLIAAGFFTLVFTLVIFFWSRRVQGVLGQIHTFAQHVIGEPRKFQIRGDVLRQLETDFTYLRDEILAARASLGQQRRMQQRLQQLELLERVADHLGIGVLLLGPEGNVELETQQVQKLETALGSQWYRPGITGPIQQEKLRLKDDLQNAYTFDMTRLSLFRPDDVVLFREVTAQEQLLERLRVRESQFQGITQSARDAIISIDASGKIVHWNPAAKDMFQHSASEIVGAPITSIMPAPHREAHCSALNRAVGTGALHSRGKPVVLEGLRKDGTTFPLELSLSTWQTGEGRYFTGILRDITERKAVEQALRESQSVFSLFMDHLPAAVFIKAARGRVYHLNKYLRTQFSAADARGKNTEGDFPAQVIERLSCGDEMVIAEGWYEIVETLEDRSGRERVFRAHNFAIPRPDEQDPLVGGIAWDITDSIRATEALRSSERRYREIFEIAEEGIWLIDAEANTVEVNDKMAQMLGYSVEEMAGRHLFDFMDEQARQEAEMLLERRRKGVAEKFDFRYRHKSGANVWTMVSTAPMFDVTGVYAGALRLVTDITERKRSEDALRAQEEQLRLILASTGEGIFGLDMDGRCTFANRACVELLGFNSAEDLVGRRMHDLIHHTRHDGTTYPVKECPTYHSCASRLVTFADDEPLWRADGTSFHAEYQSFPMVRNDAVVGAVVSFADITERKQAEAAIRHERDFAERLIETAPVIVLVLDPKGSIVRFNSFMEKLSGYSLAEVKGRNWFDTFPVKREVRQIADVLARIKEEGSAIGELHAILTRDGKERVIAWYNTTLTDPDGALAALLAVGLDVTEQKAKEAQLVQAQKMEMVGQLTGGIAHDFNNLLTVILGNLNLLSKSIGPDWGPDLFELLDDSLSAANDGAELTKRLLTFSREEPLRQKRMHLPEFLRRFERFLRRTLGAGIVVEVDVGNQVEHLLCDPSQLESALLNLALNARDAMPEGGRLRLQAAAKEAAVLDPTLRSGNYLALSMSDTGEGMDAERLSRAIEPFYTTKKEKQGTGLGLSMVYGFCEQAGGRFQLASEPGAGTRATIVLPLHDSTDAHTAQAPESSAQDVSRKGTVLVVEDEARVRRLAARFLNELGYEVLTAENGDVAIETLLSDAPIDLVFSDVVMPGRTKGDDLYRWVKAQRPQVNILLTTGMQSSEIDELTEGGESSVSIALPKPYTKEQLAAAIQEVCAT